LRIYLVGWLRSAKTESRLPEKRRSKSGKTARTAEFSGEGAMLQEMGKYALSSSISLRKALFSVGVTVSPLMAAAH
jgi:hypothetical protein